MRGIWWRLAAFMSRCLESGEQEAVLGDLSESRTTGPLALLDILGLVIRRQAALWKDWRPWLALLGIVGPGALVLSFSSVAVWGSYDLYFWIARNYRDIDPAILREAHLSLGPGILSMLIESVRFGCVAVTIGFVVGALSRRTIWINGTIFCALVSVLVLFGGGAFSASARILQALVLIPSLIGLSISPRACSRRVVMWLLWTAAIIAAIGGFQILQWPESFRPRWFLEMILVVQVAPLVYLLAANWRSLFRVFTKQPIAL